MRIEFSPGARLDLIEIADYYRKVSNSKLAKRMVGQIKNQIEVLADYPESAALYEWVPGIRRLVVASGAYLVFYRISSSVQILHIRRGERVSATTKDMESRSA